MNSPLTEHRTSSANHLFTPRTCGACWSQGSHSNSSREISRAIFARGGGMSSWVYVTLSCHNWNIMTFATTVPILFTSFLYLTNVYRSVIHGIKRKSHLSVVCNWYHWYEYAIATQWYQFHTTDAWWFSLNIYGLAVSFRSLARLYMTKHLWLWLTGQVMMATLSVNDHSSLSQKSLQLLIMWNGVTPER